MELIYLIIIVFLFLLASFDLWVGVSNDAVNFLNSAVGARVARYRTIMIVASVGVLAGALLSNGMMDIARHGIMNPSNFTFHEVMTILLAVMVTDVVILDMFNSLGLPTSTTVSMVFELLGGTFVMAILKMAHGSELQIFDLLNTEKALTVIIAIFVSVAVAFVFGYIVQWVSRLIFTFKYQENLRYTVAIFGGIAVTALSYFVFAKGLGGAWFIDQRVVTFIDTHIHTLLIVVFLGSMVVMEILHLCKVNIFKFIILAGTFALAMAFAGNDLVNFIGVPLAGLSSFQDYMMHGGGANDSFLMASLQGSAKTPMLYLAIAAFIMIFSMVTSKKARNVIKTSVDLSRQDEGDEMFGTSRAARSIARLTQNYSENVERVIPQSVRRWIDGRFDNQGVVLAPGVAFDEVRASVNLVLAALLIIIGTNLKLPLSTTYVTFMVAMSSSLADRAWGRESAVFRITGMLSVIGGWFVTAGVAFLGCMLVTLVMFYGSIGAMIAFMGLVIYLLIRSSKKFSDSEKENKEDELFKLMMRSKDPEIVWDLLVKHVSRMQAGMTNFALEQYTHIFDGLSKQKMSELRSSQSALKKEQEMLKKYRKKEILVMHLVPQELALERNTWFYLGINSAQQYIYCLKRMLEPVKEHVDNNFNPLPQSYIDEFQPVLNSIHQLMKQTAGFISTGRYYGYRDVMEEADRCKNELSVLRHKHIDRMQKDRNSKNLQISIVYLNLIQETQELLSVMRHQLRATRKFIGAPGTSYAQNEQMD